MNGETVTGVSIIHLSEKMDAGDIVLQKSVEIGPDETYGTLETRLASLGAHALVEAIGMIRAGDAPRVPQDESMATLAPHLRRGEEIIDWGKPAKAIHDLVRALSPRPGAVTWLRGERIKVWETRLLPHEKPANAKPGSILRLVGDWAVAARAIGRGRVPSAAGSARRYGQGLSRRRQDVDHRFGSNQGRED